jgi:hypothetical protein
MTIDELKQKYSGEELTSTSGNKKLNYEVFSPLFQNLFESKVVYYERFTGIVRLDDIRIDSNNFHARASLVFLMNDVRKRYKPISDHWEIGSDWAYLRLVGNGIAAYSSWMIWPDPEFVAQVEKLIKADRIKEALNLTVFAE